MTGTLESQRSLLLPTDASPRLLELLVLLDQHWQFKLTAARQSRISAEEQWPYPLCLVSRTAQDMVAFARSLIEWMGGVIRDSGGVDVVDGLENQRRGRRGRKGRQGVGVLGSEYGALDFRWVIPCSIDAIDLKSDLFSHLKFFYSPTDFLQAYPLMRPKLVLAVPATMSHGPSRWLFTAMAGAEGNVILLTSRGEDGTLTRDLYERWERDQEETAKWGKGRTGNLAHLDGPFDLQVSLPPA